MEWIPLVALVAGTLLAILVLAVRAARRGARHQNDADDPHAGLLRELARQERPRRPWES